MGRAPAAAGEHTRQALAVGDGHEAGRIGDKALRENARPGSTATVRIGSRRLVPVDPCLGKEGRDHAVADHEARDALSDRGDLTRAVGEWDLNVVALAGDAVAVPAVERGRPHPDPDLPQHRRSQWHLSDSDRAAFPIGIRHISPLTDRLCLGRRGCCEREHQCGEDQQCSSSDPHAIAPLV